MFWKTRCLPSQNAGHGQESDHHYVMPHNSTSNADSFQIQLVTCSGSLLALPVDLVLLSSPVGTSAIMQSDFFAVELGVSLFPSEAIGCSCKKPRREDLLKHVQLRPGN